MKIETAASSLPSNSAALGLRRMSSNGMTVGMQPTLDHGRRDESRGESRSTEPMATVTTTPTAASGAFSVTASKTFALSAADLFEALSDEAARDPWLAAVQGRLGADVPRRARTGAAVVAHVRTHGPGRSVLTVA